jgi:hypothetical protein
MQECFGYLVSRNLSSCRTQLANATSLCRRTIPCDQLRESNLEGDDTRQTTRIPVEDIVWQPTSEDDLYTHRCSPWVLVGCGITCARPDRHHYCVCGNRVARSITVTQYFLAAYTPISANVSTS